MQKRRRIFIAINLPEEIKRELVFYANKWPELPAKWTVKDNLHITLEFLGYLTDQELGEVCMIAKEVAKRHNPFSINLNKIVYGPDNGVRPGSDPGLTPRAPKMIWAEGEKSNELSDLKQDLQEYLLEKINFKPEGRGFAPHITLARIKEWEWKKIEPEERPEVNENIDLVFFVESIEVMESELKRGGSQYTILESHLFNNETMPR